jgi:hypothetical protein
VKNVNNLNKQVKTASIISTPAATNELAELRQFLLKGKAASVTAGTNELVQLRKILFNKHG